MNITCEYEKDGVITQIGDYIATATWSGDESQAARKLEFSIAYNPHDTTFNQLNLELGGIIRFSVDNYHIFEGRLFYRKRSSNSNTYDFTAYDSMIYLAKSKIYKLFDKVTVTNAIKQICQEIGVPTASQMLDVLTTVTFIADGMSCTEVFTKLLDLAKADLKKKYAVIFINGGVQIVARGTLIENYIASDAVDVISSDHSESIEDMVNRVRIVDEKGNVVAVAENGDDIKAFGILQHVFKAEPPRQGQPDNMTQAKGMLKRVGTESSVHAIGNIQCITGYSVTVQEEQLKGNFYIKADSHTFENNTHMMQLTLEYIEGSATNAGNK